MTKAEVKILIKFPSGHTEVMTVDEVSALVKDLSKAIGADKKHDITAPQHPWRHAQPWVHGGVDWWGGPVNAAPDLGYPSEQQTIVQSINEKPRVDVVTRVESEK